MLVPKKKLSFDEILITSRTAFYYGIRLRYSFCRSHNTQATEVVPVVRVVVVPVGNSAVVRVVVPAATAFHAVRPRRHTCSLLLKNAVFIFYARLSSISLLSRISFRL